MVTKRFLGLVWYFCASGWCLMSVLWSLVSHNSWMGVVCVVMAVANAAVGYRLRQEDQEAQRQTVAMILASSFQTNSMQSYGKAAAPREHQDDTHTGDDSRPRT